MYRPISLWRLSHLCWKKTNLTWPNSMLSIERNPIISVIIEDLDFGHFISVNGMNSIFCLINTKKYFSIFSHFWLLTTTEKIWWLPENNCFTLSPAYTYMKPRPDIAGVYMQSLWDLFRFWLFVQMAFVFLESSYFVRCIVSIVVIAVYKYILMLLKFVKESWWNDYQYNMSIVCH